MSRCYGGCWGLPCGRAPGGERRRGPPTPASARAPPLASAWDSLLSFRPTCCALGIWKPGWVTDFDKRYFGSFLIIFFLLGKKTKNKNPASQLSVGDGRKAVLGWHWANSECPVSWSLGSGIRPAHTVPPRPRCPLFGHGALGQKLGEVEIIQCPIC